MRITGLVIACPDPAAARSAWRRLGVSGVDVEVTAGEGGLLAVVLGVEDVATTERLLRRRGLGGHAGGIDIAGLQWRLAPAGGGDGGGGVTLDHLVVRTGDAERAVANYGGRLGLDLRLDRRLEEHGFRGLFFRCGDAVVEVAAPTKGVDGPDSFGGLAWRAADLDATRERLVADGVEVSGIRSGRKPGTRVATVRDPHLGTPTLLVGHT
ncbi:VOC family protein [Janibacter sp. GS2]|uniref:VOC family protein n=1 Tax=Janibacter sp. GS2 TaxID=3442646 RepID=UPI003EBDC2A2